MHVLTRSLRDAPRPLILACILSFCAAYFASRFPDVPGAGVGSYVSTFLIAMPACAALFRYLGERRAALSLLALSAFGYAIETTGVATGLPYGRFYYGEALGAKAFGLVPYLLPVSYVPLVIGAVAASWRADTRRKPTWVLRSALLLVLLDGVLDPGATSLGFWVWPGGGAYYGVPLSNFAGWLLSGVLASALLLAVGRWGTGGRAVPPPGLLDSTIVATAFWIGVSAFSNLALPALLGVALLAYLLARRHQFRIATEKAPTDRKTPS